MLEVFKKAFLVLRTRPLQIFGMASQYWRFWRTRKLMCLLAPMFRGVSLGRNVRVQALGCLCAEQPAARISVGEDSIIYEFARVEAYGAGTIEIGRDSIIGEARIYARERVSLGERVVTSWNVFIQDFDPHPLDPAQRGRQMLRMTRGFRPRYGAAKPLPELPWAFPTAPVSIGNDVWLGANVTILKGARIGDGCVVATGSVVTAGEYPPRSVIAGVPARVVKSL